MSEVMLEFDNVWKKFRRGELKHDSLRDLIPHLGRRLLSGGNGNRLREMEFWALKEVSFRIRRGEALGIIGPNGAGKSTILKLLSGILKPNAGAIRVNGRLSALIEIGAGFHPDLTGRENIYLNGAILGMRRDEINRKIGEIIDFSGLSEFIDTPVKRYSSGMYARLGFSVAAHVDPEILLVDEVLSVGDLNFQQRCLRKITEVVKRGTTVIFISHNIPSVMVLCPRTILLSRGEIQRFGDSREVCRYYYSSNAEAQQKGGERLKVSGYELLSAGDSPSAAFQAGEWATFKVSVQSFYDVKDLIMGFLIKRDDGVMVFDANSDKVADRYYSFSAGETKEIKIRFRANLPAGTYYLGVHFVSIESEYYFYDDEVMEFYVTAPVTVGGAYLDMDWAS
jgi:lipopolysaccharide transport system ATP-binding protein